MQEDSKKGYGCRIMTILVVMCVSWWIIKSYPIFFQLLLGIGLAVGGVFLVKMLDAIKARVFVAVFVIALITALCALTTVYTDALPLCVFGIVIAARIYIKKYCWRRTEEQRIREEEERRRRFEEAAREWNERITGKFREIESWSMNSSVILDSNVWMNEGISEPSSICLSEFTCSGLHDLHSRCLVDKWNDCVYKYPFLVLIEVLASSYCPNAKLFVSGWQLDELLRIRKQTQFVNGAKGNRLKFNNGNKASILAVQALKRIEKLQKQSPPRIEVEDVHAWPNIRAYLDAFLINKAKGLCKSGTPLTVVTNDRDLRIRLRGVAGDSESVCVLDRADVIQLLSLSV